MGESALSMDYEGGHLQCASTSCPAVVDLPSVRRKKKAPYWDPARVSQRMDQRNLRAITHRESIDIKTN